MKTEMDMETKTAEAPAGSAKLDEQVAALEAAGMVAAATKLKEAAAMRRKLAVAYEHYRFVRPEKIEAYCERLKKATYREGKYSATWRELSFTPLEKYPQVPPADVVKATTAARGMQCFDVFEVAHIIEVKDPIVFGRVNGCADRFFIAQWDDDVRIEDILNPNEG